MLVDLDGELLHAMAQVTPEIAQQFREQGFTNVLHWGLTRVTFFGPEGRLYEPYEDGKAMAFIVPVVEEGELVDLAAIDGPSQHVGLRMGGPRALGADAIETAKWGLCRLHLCERPLDWLRHQQQARDEARRFITDCYRIAQGEKAPDIDPTLPVDYAYLFRIGDVLTQCEGIDKIVCEGIDLDAQIAFAKRVAAMLPPSHRQRVVTP